MIPTLAISPAVIAGWFDEKNRTDGRNGTEGLLNL